MKRPSGPPQLHLASSVTEKAQVANSDERLRSALTALEQCRAFLIDGGNHETAQLVSVAILDLRMKLNRIADSELRALCDAVSPKSPHGRSRRSQASLKLIK